MATKIEKSKLSRLLRETLGLAVAQGPPVIINEPPVVPVHPTPSVTGTELGSIKKTASFESNQTMKNLGRFLSKLSEDQQQRVYKNLKKAAHKLTTDESKLYSLIGNLIKEASVDMRDMDPTDAAAQAAQEDAYLDMIDSGDAEIDEDDITAFFSVGDKPQPDNANLRREKYTKTELAQIDLLDPSLRMGVNALTVGEVIDAISIQMGLSRSAVTNALYDYMKKMGDDQIRRRPSERRAIPTSADQEKMGTAVEVDNMLYTDFREELEGYGDMFPELVEKPYPENLDDLPQNDYRRELFRNYARLFLMTQYGDDIRSSADLQANWHTLADETGNPPREHGNGKPHSQSSSLHGFIIGDVRELIGMMNSSDFEQLLKRAQSLIDAGKTAGGQGWKGVVKKVDKEAEKMAKKKAKVKAKAAKKNQ